MWNESYYNPVLQPVFPYRIPVSSSYLINDKSIAGVFVENAIHLTGIQLGDFVLRNPLPFHHPIQSVTVGLVSR